MEAEGSKEWKARKRKLLSQILGTRIKYAEVEEEAKKYAAEEQVAEKEQVEKKAPTTRHEVEKSDGPREDHNQSYDKE